MTNEYFAAGAAAADLELLLWLHAEAVWKACEFEKLLTDAQLDVLMRGRRITGLAEDLATAVDMVKTCTGHPDSSEPSHFDAIRRERSSRQAWAEEAVRLDHAYDEAVKSLRAEIAWQKHAYRDGTDKVATGRTIGMEDALRTLTGKFVSRPVCTVHPFRHANGEACAGCQMCLAEALSVLPGEKP